MKWGEQMEITQLNNHSDTHLTYPDTLELNKVLTIIAGPNGYGKSSLLMGVKRSVQDSFIRLLKLKHLLENQLLILFFLNQLTSSQTLLFLPMMGTKRMTL